MTQRKPLSEPSNIHTKIHYDTAQQLPYKPNFVHCRYAVQVSQLIQVPKGGNSSQFVISFLLLFELLSMKGGNLSNNILQVVN